MNKKFKYISDDRYIDVFMSIKKKKKENILIKKCMKQNAK